MTGTYIDDPEHDGEIAGRRAGRLYQNAVTAGALVDVRAALPAKIPEARIEAQCMVATDCPQTQSAGRFWLSFYDALEAHIHGAEGDNQK
jgi:hypothetical protein